VIWTTTPWTIPANMGVAANKGFTYALVYALPGQALEEASKEAGLDPSALTDKHADGTPKPMRFADRVARMKEAVGRKNWTSCIKRRARSSSSPPTWSRAS